MSRSLSISDMLAILSFLRFLCLLRLIGEDNRLVHPAFFEVRRKPFAILVGHLLNIHAQQPPLLAFLAAALRIYDLDDRLNRAFRQIDANKQQSTESRHFGL